MQSICSLHWSPRLGFGSSQKWWLQLSFEILTWEILGNVERSITLCFDLCPITKCRKEIWPDLKGISGDLCSCTENCKTILFHTHTICVRNTKQFVSEIWNKNDKFKNRQTEKVTVNLYKTSQELWMLSPSLFIQRSQSNC